MFAIILYMICLTIAPQLWIRPFIGLPTDYISFTLMVFTLIIQGRGNNFLQFSTIDYLLSIFAFWVTLSAIANGWTPESQLRVIFYWKMLILSKFLMSLITDFEKLKKISNWLVFIAVILAVQAIQQKFGDGVGWAHQGRGWIDPIAAAGGEVGRSRWIGIFGGEGVYAVIFTATFPLMYPYLLKEYNYRIRIFAAAVILILLLATYCTGSRGGLVASLFVIALYIMIRAKFKLKSIIKASIIIFIVLNLAPSYLTTINDVSRSSQYRVEMWADGLDMLKQNILLGVGPGNFILWTGRLIAHNSAIELAGELGFIGLFLWIAMIYACIKIVIMYNTISADTLTQWYCIALILSLTGYIVSAMFATLEYETLYLILSFCGTFERFGKFSIKLETQDLIFICCIGLLFLIFLQLFAIAYLG